ncbi:hypothetical protein NADFUDRAFT_50170 [Nadsonia fulvescens var. elongata DSM 6958]|uniref:Vacuolar ATPase assembly protein VMA22 n=1 Tax=Nadsonia fulvescens var. elongata DSM 6958 TaxID=857566 RepID=A0A1E3PLD0_9ASCO|nr:hypothetical protein NADFUDRAFT_50170 [Nadsonia fulvescens var. elongata DSM 6958]
MSLSENNTDVCRVLNEKDQAVSAPNAAQKSDDALIIKYLDLITQYQALRDALSTHFASGYFSLTRANYAGSGSMGGLLNKRYGQYGWDQRPRNAEVSIADAATTARLTKKEGFEKKTIRQFGILAPKTLKDGQNDFIAGLDMAMELVDVIKRLDELEKEITI